MAGALTGGDRKIDVVRAVRSDPDKEQSFLVMAGMGYDATIMADTNEDLKDKVGWLAYVDAGIRNLPGKPVKANIVIDGKSVSHRRVRSVMVGNCGKVQGGLEIFPDAKVDDGLLDVVVLAPRGRLGWFSVVAGLIGKGKGKDTSVEFFQGKTVEITFEHADDYQIDGDHEGDTKYVQYDHASRRADRPYERTGRRLAELASGEQKGSTAARSQWAGRRRFLTGLLFGRTESVRQQPAPPRCEQGGPGKFEAVPQRHGHGVQHRNAGFCLHFRCNVGTVQVGAEVDQGIRGGLPRARASPAAFHRP